MDQKDTKERYSRICKDLTGLALELAAAQKKLTIKTGFADGWWGVTLLPDGRTEYFGYAEESRGASGTVNDLTTSELAQLIESGLKD